jgi:hypothetical protein
MKKKILTMFFASFIGVSFASDLSNWSNEDLCRWVDSVSIPEPISLEIKLREVICYANSELVESSLAAPYQNEHGTVFPSPPVDPQPVKKQSSGVNFSISYKITL